MTKDLRVIKLMHEDCLPVFFTGIKQYYASGQVCTVFATAAGRLIFHLRLIND